MAPLPCMRLWYILALEFHNTTVEIMRNGVCGTCACRHRLSFKQLRLGALHPKSTPLVVKTFVCKSN